MNFSPATVRFGNTVRRLAQRVGSGCLFASLAVLASTSPATAFDIATDFPGGNVTVDAIEGNLVKLSPDLKDTKVPWFYWYFAVRGAEGQTLQFAFKPSQVGARGPGVSVDGGRTWQWMGIESVKDGVFSYTFSPEAREVRFSNGMPYVAADFDRFLEKFKGRPDVRVETLTKSPKGRDVPLVLIDSPNRKTPYAVALTCRHHSSEMMASYVLEGILLGVLADDAQGRWLRDHVDFLVVPFADMDGVEDGDQGKNRAPHDHNRDYAGTPIYPEVAAIKEKIPAWSADRPLIFVDIHNPSLKADIHEVIQFLAPEQEDQAARLSRLVELVALNNQGSIIFRRNMIMKFGSGYNGITGTPPPISAGWARTLPNILFGVSLEMPFANANGSEVNAETAREFGQDIAWGLAAYLKELPKPAAP